MSHLPDYFEHLVRERGLTSEEAVERLALAQNGFASAAARRWFFANLGKLSGKLAGKKAGPMPPKLAASLAKKHGLIVDGDLTAKHGKADVHVIDLRAALKDAHRLSGGLGIDDDAVDKIASKHLGIRTLDPRRSQSFYAVERTRLRDALKAAFAYRKPLPVALGLVG